MTTAPAAATEEAFLTVAEIARRFRTSRMTVYRMVHGGEFVGAVRIGRGFRVPASSVEAYLAGNTIEAVDGR
ncbi:helix-turn-helix domain-containing protein [Nonomuraea sediminis]|uniref:helix-turn-helix domain-containing protein n=1 Tax=Nonomuraea sediminis TaxID=2835864 RepID=UPI0027E07936|nr:helix-turn-helix domain-containing protein [Nonomuraea sediminis]